MLDKLKEELKELSIKIENLDKFIKSNTYNTVSEAHKFLLRKQLLFMSLYQSTLLQRVVVTETSYESYVPNFGEEVIGLFGTEDSSVFEIKVLGGELIDAIETYGKDKRLSSIAKTNIETGVMFGVKSYHK